MTTTKNTLVAAKGFFGDVESFSKTEEKAAFSSLIEKLSSNPYSVVEEAHASGDFFASRALNDVYLYWSLDYPDSLSLTEPPRVKLLALRNAAVRPRRSVAGRKQNNI